jgi:hypothetical protein
MPTQKFLDLMKSGWQSHGRLNLMYILYFD